MMDTWKDIQAAVGAKPDGIPGPLTAKAVAAKLGVDLAGLYVARPMWREIQAATGAAVDGIPGPETRGAVARALARLEGADGESPVGLDPYGLARTYIGTREIPGKRHNPLIVRWHRRLATWISDDETAWCSSFVNAMAAETGRECSGKLDARSWLKVGTPVSLSEARPGDVVVFWRGSPSSWQGHVGFFEHHHRSRELIYTLGGNQGNEVNVSAYPESRLLGIRRLRTLDRAQGATSAMV